jgi:hypothetical protein
MSTVRDDGAVLVSAENLHGMHHGEIVVFKRDADGPGAMGVLYNSLGIDHDIS